MRLWEIKYRVYRVYCPEPCIDAYCFRLYLDIQYCTIVGLLRNLFDNHFLTACYIFHHISG